MRWQTTAAAGWPRATCDPLAGWSGHWGDHGTYGWDSRRAALARVIWLRARDWRWWPW